MNHQTGIKHQASSIQHQELSNFQFMHSEEIDPILANFHFMFVKIWIPYCKLSISCFWIDIDHIFNTKF